MLDSDTWHGKLKQFNLHQIKPFNNSKYDLLCNAASLTVTTEIDILLLVYTEYASYRHIACEKKQLFIHIKILVNTDYASLGHAASETQKLTTNIFITECSLRFIPIRRINFAAYNML